MNLSSEKTKRVFIPGEEWLYYKLYAGKYVADEILVDAMDTLIKRFFEENLIDKWFFIRYSDPDPHIRIRLHQTSDRSLSYIVAELKSVLRHFVDKGTIWKVQIDSYHRELERYNHGLINIAESMFFHDSAMVINLLRLFVSFPDMERQRWHFALRSVDALINDFQLKEESKLLLIENMRKSYAKEFGMNRMLKQQLDKKYRKESGYINDFLVPERDSSMLTKLINERSEHNIQVLEGIVKDENELADESYLLSFITSIIHMSMNRIFVSKQRLNELVVYDFLFRYYKSRNARKRFSESNSEF
jgi:thiopeptide-type bacteriocin biosynthesis protein